MRAFFKERMSAWPRSPFARVVLRRLIVGAIPVLFATSAAAVPVTFDLTNNAGFIYFDSGKTLTSDLGTTATMSAYAAAGNLQSTGTQDVFGAGTAQAPNVPVAVFGCQVSTNDCSALRFIFPTDVKLLSITVTVLGLNAGMTVFAGASNLGSSIFSGGKYPEPPVSVIDYDPNNINNVMTDVLRIQARSGGSFSIRSITVDDPSAVAVPEPATSLLLLVGLAGLGITTARRRKLAA